MPSLYVHSVLYFLLVRIIFWGGEGEGVYYYHSVVLFSPKAPSTPSKPKTERATRYSTRGSGLVGTMLLKFTRVQSDTRIDEKKGKKRHLFTP